MDALPGLALDLEASPIYYNKADYIQTASGNKVSRASVLCGSQNITLVGNSVIKRHDECIDSTTTYVMFYDMIRYNMMVDHI